MSSYVFSNAIMFLREVSWMAGAGLFTDIDHHQVVALASCFLPVEKSNEQVHLKNELAWPLRKLQDTARKIAEVFSPSFDWSLFSMLNMQSYLLAHLMRQISHHSSHIRKK
jgi:superfamily II RNA helicase